ncbi:CHAT domain-containing protein [Laspinema sp. D1]|uniref:CHAT domain-containing protein n=1 Tax=Laspinema palackyanum TaxID=3231601 RepID=UPI00348CD023|nr:CHAT domain-containing protein [Laspinema sp. D2b]
MKTILILSVNPPGTTRLRLDREVREIQATLKRSKYRDSFQIVTEGAVRVDDLRRALLDHKPAIVHFSGHGVGSEGLVLENDAGQTQLVSSESLANLFKLFQTQVECVLLNACYSDIQAQVIHQYIDYLIGMNCPIGDEAAIKFSIGFYDALGAGEPYERCFEIGCASITLEGIPEAETPKLKARPRAYSFPGIKEPDNSENVKSPAPPSPPEKKTSQTMNINVGHTMSNNEISQAKGDIQQIQNISNGGSEASSFITDIFKLIKQIERIIDKSELSEKHKLKALSYLENVQEEMQEDEPNQDFAMKNLQKITKVLKEVNETAEAGAGVLQKLEPLFTQLASGLGVSAENFGSI